MVGQAGGQKDPGRTLRIGLTAGRSRSADPGGRHWQEASIPITHRASAESERYDYEAFGSSEETARSALLEGLEEHAGQMSIEDGWTTEMMLGATVEEIGAGGASFLEFGESGPIDDGAIPALSTIDDDEAFRAAAETRRPGHGWGDVAGYGRTEEEATAAVRKRLDHMFSAEPTATHLENAMAELDVYPIREGGSYRGGLVERKGEELT